MAKRSKGKKGQTSNPDQLKPEKEEKLTIKQVIRDERTHKIAGAVFLLFSAFLLVAFTSYLFNWREDQDKVLQGASILFPSSDVKTANLLVNLGAYISHQFFYKGFGLASYFICTYFFISGWNWLFAKKVFSIVRNLRYVIVGILYFSVTLAFVGKGTSFSWGGAVGDMIADWLTKALGWIGTAALLFIGGLAFIIWRFNPVFKMPTIPASRSKSDLGVKKIGEDGEIGERKRIW
jgi:S-DNA-T family DNA segregation ATPase FtsK/SpoIIIE